MKKVILLFLFLVIGCSVEPEIIYKDKMVYQDRIIFKENYTKTKEAINRSVTFVQNNFDSFFEDYLEDKKTTQEEYAIYLADWGSYEGIVVNKYINPTPYVKCVYFESEHIEDLISEIENYMWLNFVYDPSKRDRRPTPYKAMDKMTGDCTEKAVIYNELFKCNGIGSRVVTGYRGNIKHDWIEVLYPSDNWVYWKPLEMGNERNGLGYA